MSFNIKAKRKVQPFSLLNNYEKMNWGKFLPLTLKRLIDGYNITVFKQS